MCKRSENVSLIYSKYDMYVEYYFSAQLTLQHWHSLTDQQVIFLLHIQYMVETYWQMFVLHCCSSLAAFPVFTPLIGQIFHRGLLLPSIVIFFSFCTAWAKQQSPATKPQQVAVEIQRRQLPTFKHWAGLFGWWSRRHILGMTLFWHQHSPSQTVLSLTYTWGLWGGLGWKRVSLITLFNQSVLVQGRNGIITHYVELKNICLFFSPMSCVM